MKRELALKLLRQILPDSEIDEDQFREVFSELETLAELKYNRYEMYKPGRLFFENLYAWLNRFPAQDRIPALNFIRQELIFISREEFQQLAEIVYEDRIKQRQLTLVSEETGLSRHKVKKLSESDSMSRIHRASLFVGMSDGARIDYFRRQNLKISNEQMLPSYEPSDERIRALKRELGSSLGGQQTFECLFLLDDFSASGKTLIREVIKERLTRPLKITIPSILRSVVEYDLEKQELEFKYRENGINDDLLSTLLGIDESKVWSEAIASIKKKNENRDTQLKGSLVRLADGKILSLLEPTAHVYFCPLLITQYALERLTELVPRLTDKRLSSLEVMPGAVIPNTVRITNDASTANEAISNICRTQYDEDLGDEHTGNVMFGYDSCGLPLVLHHNTPNNSLYLLWSRRWGDPLFIRYERHGRTGL